MAELSGVVGGEGGVGGGAWHGRGFEIIDFIVGATYIHMTTRRLIQGRACSFSRALGKPDSVISFHTCTKLLYLAVTNHFLDYLH